jgi:hypothetical protein
MRKIRFFLTTLWIYLSHKVTGRVDRHGPIDWEYSRKLAHRRIYPEQWPLA